MQFIFNNCPYLLNNQSHNDDEWKDIALKILSWNSFGISIVCFAKMKINGPFIKDIGFSFREKIYSYELIDKLRNE